MSPPPLVKTSNPGNSTPTPDNVPPTATTNVPPPPSIAGSSFQALAQHAAMMAAANANNASLPQTATTTMTLPYLNLPSLAGGGGINGNNGPASNTRSMNIGAMIGNFFARGFGPTPPPTPSPTTMPSPTHIASSASPTANNWIQPGHFNSIDPKNATATITSTSAPTLQITRFAMPPPPPQQQLTVPIQSQGPTTVLPPQKKRGRPQKGSKPLRIPVAITPTAVLIPPAPINPPAKVKSARRQKRKASSPPPPPYSNSVPSTGAKASTTTTTSSSSNATTTTSTSASTSSASASAAASLNIPAPKFHPPSASLPIPPDYMEHHEETIASLETYKIFPVDPNSVEYSTLKDFCSPVKVLSIEQILNPELFTRFTHARKELFRNKSDDLSLLTKLGYDDREVQRMAHFSINFDKDPAIASSPYSDNLVILFHCTRSAANVESILKQGLDERLGNAAGSGGLLGRGIYFADNPVKSMAYDGTTGILLLCAVLLGDCLSVDHLPNRNTLVREPEKGPEQKRNFNDQFFDSIVGRPGPHNEYVIYNRYQCLPLYQVKYQRGAALAQNNYTPYSHPRLSLPPIAWTPQAGAKVTPMPNNQKIPWPYLAGHIFTQGMGKLDEEDQLVQEEKKRAAAIAAAAAAAEEEAEAEALMQSDMEEAIKASMETLNNSANNNNTAGGGGAAAGNSANNSPGNSSSEYATMLDKLDTLSCLGFTDEVKNTRVLMLYENDLDRAVNHLLDGGYNSQDVDLELLEQQQQLVPDSVGNNTTTIAGTVVASTLTVAAATTLPSTSGASSSPVPPPRLASPPIPMIHISDEEDDDEDNNSQSSKESGDWEDMDDLFGFTPPPHRSSTPSSSPSKQGNSTSSAAAAAAGFATAIASPQIVMEECPICCEEFLYDPQNSNGITNFGWAILACSHKICTECHKQIQTTRTTMSGVTHTSVKCPFCQGNSGIEIGTCPNGTMTVKEIKNPCKGHENHTTWSITYYSTDPKYPLNRIAYIPNTEEGRRLVALLKIAWDRRLCFTIGTSNTTGQENVLVWNIHHKTALDDKVSHGYPDPEYLDRLRWELKAFGIE